MPDKTNENKSAAEVKPVGKLRRIWTLFYSILYISSCTFGGGFVIVTFMKRRFADELHWIDDTEILDMTASNAARLQSGAS